MSDPQKLLATLAHARERLALTVADALQLEEGDAKEIVQALENFIDANIALELASRDQ